MGGGGGGKGRGVGRFNPRLRCLSQNPLLQAEDQSPEVQQAETTVGGRAIPDELRMDLFPDGFTQTLCLNSTVRPLQLQMPLPDTSPYGT